MNEMAEIGLYLALFMTIMVILIGVNLYRYTKERRFKNKASYMLRMIEIIMLIVILLMVLKHILKVLTTYGKN